MLLLVRHGETPPNRQGLLLGRADPSLTDAGHEHARQLAATLPVPDLVVSSPLRRARDTASAFGRPVELDERWIELDYGELDGQPSAAVAAGVWAQWRSDASFAPPGGESLDALSIRVRAACAELAAAAATSTVVVVTHVSPIKAALAWALDVPVGIAWRMYVEDSSVSRIDIEPQGPVVRWFNRGPVRVD
ncbi:MAG TPA: histidine phosphatase family protein [Ilumatobacteraceae bacterium]|nr:histidine phosphatase family protein [Ilumatobacteraceae bacterium]